MALRWWWLTAGFLVAALVVAVLAHWLPIRPSTPAPDAVLAAHTDRIRTLPLYRRLVGRHLRSLLAQWLCVLLALIGAALVAGRLSQPDTRRESNRDIMLCLDVSGSMGRVDALVVDNYLQLVRRLGNERIGFVIFDSSAVTVFPLTRDTGFIDDQLRRARDGLAVEDPDVIVGSREGRSGSSLVGDGLASCTQRFDQQADDRPRTVVLATDNVVNGEPIYPLPQAIDLARQRRIMVYAIAPDIDKPVELGALQDQVRRTGGELLRVRPGERTDPGAIVAAVESRQRELLRDQGIPESEDQPWPGAVLLGTGLLGAAWTGRRARR